MAELELVGGYNVLAPLAEVHMETGDLQAELTVAAVAHNYAPFLLGNDFFDLAESVPGFVRIIIECEPLIYITKGIAEIEGLQKPTRMVRRLEKVLYEETAKIVVAYLSIRE